MTPILYLQILLVLTICWAAVEDSFETHPFSDPYPHPSGTIRIEMGAAINGKYGSIELQTIAGLLLWRDYVNNSTGGICLKSGHNPTNCRPNNRYRINLVIWLLSSSEAEKYIKSGISTWASNIQNRIESLRPHFLICPTGLDFTLECFNWVSMVRGISAPSGNNILTFSGSGDQSVFEYEHEFPVSVWTESYHIMNTLGNLLTTFYNVSSIGILTDADAGDDYIQLSEHLFTRLSSENISILRVCSNQRYNPAAVTCSSDLECDAGAQCVLPQVKRDLGSDRVLEAERLTKEWLKRFQSLELDGLFYSAQYDLFSATNYIKEIEYTPKYAIAGDLRFLYYEGIKSDELIAKWFGVSKHDEQMIFGVSGQYMGDTQEYLDYISGRYQQYLDPLLFKRGTNDLKHNYNYISTGSLNGIVIQRLLEISSSLIGNAVDPFGSFFTESTFYILRNTLQKEFGMCYSINDEPINSNCGSNTSCPRSDQICKSWETFHSKVAFDTNTINQGPTGVIGQIFKTSGTPSYNLTYPIDISQCKRPGYPCTIAMNYTNCGCPSEFPAYWDWNKVFHKIYLDFSSIHHILLFILIFVSVGIILYIYYRGKVKWANKLVAWPKCFFYSYFAYIGILGSQLFLFIPCNTFVCNCYAFFNDISTSFFVIINIKTILISLDKYKGIESNDLQIKSYFIITFVYSVIIQCILQFIYIPKTIHPITYINNIPNVFTQCSYDGKTHIILIVYLVAFSYLTILASYLVYRKKNPFYTVIFIPSSLYFIVIVSFMLLYRYDISFTPIIPLYIITLYSFLQLILFVCQIYFFRINDGVTLKKTKNMSKFDDFKTLLSSPVYRVFFQQYMSTYNEQNIMKLYEEILESNNIVDMQLKQKTCKTILNKYCRQSSNIFVRSIPPDTVKPVETKIQAGNLSGGVFDEMVDFIQNYLYTNGYYRDFYNSAAYYEYEYFVLIENTFYKFKTAVNHALQEELETMSQNRQGGVATDANAKAPIRTSIIGPLKRAINPTIQKGIKTNVGNTLDAATKNDIRARNQKK